MHHFNRSISRNSGKCARLLTLFLFVLTVQLSAQKKTETTFFTEKWTPADSSKARFKRVVAFSNISKGAATMQVVDLLTGKGKILIRYSDFFKGIKNGPELHYNDDGTLKIRAFYRAGVLIDTLRTYYPTQQLRRVEAYSEGKLLGGTCWDETGAVKECLPFKMPPEPVNGIKGIASIQRNIRYPEAARSAGIEGKVVVSFVVSLDGTIGSPIIEESVHPLVDNEAILAINQSTVKWKPGTIEGEPTEMRIKLPFMFRLGN